MNTFDDFKAGDTVRVVKEYWSERGSDRDGQLGVIAKIDRDDDDYPFEIIFDDRDGPKWVWVHKIEPVETNETATDIPHSTTVPLGALLEALGDVPGTTINHVVTILKANGVELI